MEEMLVHIMMIMENRLEAVKDWVYDNITEMSQYIRFTRQSGMMA